MSCLISLELLLFGLTVLAGADSLSRRSVDLDCHDSGVVDIETGVEYLIQSPNYPDLYPSNEICTFEFKTDCEKSVTFECSDFDMQPSTGCEKDYLMFILDENTKEGEKICNSNFDLSDNRGFHFQNDFGVQFRTGRWKNFRGFSCKLEFSETSTNCNVEPTTTVDLDCHDSGVVDIEPGVQYLIQSPNYPDLYPSKEICTFEFRTDCEKSVTFECDDFDIQPSTGCEKDYLLFILDENTKEGEKICNSNFGLSDYRGFHFQNDFGVRFRTGRWKNFRGFSCKLEFSKTSTNCNVETTTMSDWNGETTDGWYVETSTDDWYNETSTDDWYNETSTDDWYGETTTNDWYQETTTDDWYETSTMYEPTFHQLQCRESEITFVNPADVFFLYSPNYPWSYNSSECCGYQFSVDQKMRASFWCWQFDLPSDHDCANNYLDFSVDDSNEKDRICNENFNRQTSYREFEIDSYFGIHFKFESDQDFEPGNGRFKCDLTFYPAYADYSDYSWAP